MYEVEDEDGKRYALKCLKPEGLTTQRVKRFKNEIAFCARKEHRNIVPIVDWGFVQRAGDRLPFYVMPIYQTTLRRLMRDGIPPERVLPWFGQLLDGLEAAHLMEVWHGDLKPENLLYDPDPDLLVISDFGIAHFAEPLLQTMVETRASERLANFRYAAPEQRTEGMVDHRADVYALGAQIMTAQGCTSASVSNLTPSGSGYFDPWVPPQVARKARVGLSSETVRQPLLQTSWTHSNSSTCSRVR